MLNVTQDITKVVEVVLCYTFEVFTVQALVNYTHENHIRLQLIVHNFLLNVVCVTVQSVEVKFSDSSD